MKFSISAIVISISVFSSAAAQEPVSRGGLRNFGANQMEALKHLVGENDADNNSKSSGSIEKKDLDFGVEDIYKDRCVQKCVTEGGHWFILLALKTAAAEVV